MVRYRVRQGQGEWRHLWGIWHGGRRPVAYRRSLNSAMDWILEKEMRVNTQKILSQVLGGTYGGPSISREEGRWVLYSWTDAPVNEEILVQHEDWTKFVWLCGEWYRERQNG